MSVPRVDPLYWVTLFSASVFGTNTGDIMSHTPGRGGLGLGDARGLPYLAAAFAILVLADRAVAYAHAGRPGRGLSVATTIGLSTVFYWLLLIVMRTAATNLADLATLQAELDYGSTVAILAALLVMVLLASRLVRTVWRGARSADAAPTPSAGVAYWLAMLVAATLGTAVGDAGAHLLPALGSIFDGGLRTMAMISVVLFVLAFWPVRRSGADTAAYWATVVVARAAGTNIGDLLAFKRGSDLGLPTASLLTGLIFAVMVVLSVRHAWAANRQGAGRPMALAGTSPGMP